MACWLIKYISLSLPLNNNKHGVFPQFRNAPNLFPYWVLACNWNKHFSDCSTFCVFLLRFRCMLTNTNKLFRISVKMKWQSKLFMMPIALSNHKQNNSKVCGNCVSWKITQSQGNNPYIDSVAFVIYNLLKSLLLEYVNTPVCVLQSWIIPVRI